MYAMSETHTRKENERRRNIYPTYKRRHIDGGIYMSKWKREDFIPGGSVPVTLTRGDLGGCVEAWLRWAKDRQAAHLNGRARSKQRVSVGVSPEGEASGALKWWGTACKAGDGATITPLSRRWRDHAALAPLLTILSEPPLSTAASPHYPTKPFCSYNLSRHE